jgi:hypothetical protein
MPEEKKKVVNSVVCSKCKQKRFVNPKAFLARVKKYGSVEEIEKNWICRECKPKKVKAVKIELEKGTKESLKTSVKKVADDIKKNIPVASLAK